LFNFNPKFLKFRFCGRVPIFFSADKKNPASNMNVTLAALLSSQCKDTSDRTVPQDFVTPSSLDDEMLLNTIGQQKRSGSQIKPPPPIQNLATAESKLTAT
jgi:hypothetical protein